MNNAALSTANAEPVDMFAASTLDANSIAETLLGNTIYANVLLLGSAWQQGLVPVSLKGLMRAIELNGVEIEKNKQAFGWGRVVAVDFDAVARLMNGDDAAPADATLDDVINRRSEFLVSYQNEALAQQYRNMIQRIREVENRLGGIGLLTDAAARSYFKLLSYKDEYEVARLHTETGFLASVRRDYGNNAKLRFHLAPPLLSRTKDARGRPRKKEFGAWIIPIFRLLARMRGLRGTKLDVFGLTAERRMERALITEFEELIDRMIPSLSAANLALGHEIIASYMDIRGFGPVKEGAAAIVRDRVASLLQDYLNVDRRAA